MDEIVPHEMVHDFLAKPTPVNLFVNRKLKPDHLHRLLQTLDHLLHQRTIHKPAVCAGTFHMVHICGHEM